jgi:hypothetical protein
MRSIEVHEVAKRYRIGGRWGTTVRDALTFRRSGDADR